jgi:C_GCAxxG_C_C family probable redox protein
MCTDEKKRQCSCMTRREALKLSLVAGATLATGGIAKVTEAASKGKGPVNKPEHAKYQFLKSMNCSQAILETYGPEMGLPINQARKVAAAFAGGMGMGSECGAITGAYMVIGMKYGKTTESDSRADNATFKRLAEFNKEFKARHKFMSCSELLETDMSTPEGVKSAASKGYFTSRCPEFVKSAAEILNKVLAS